MNDEKNYLNELDWDIPPERDLWPGIKSNIRFSGKPETFELDDVEAKASSQRMTWLPISVAACLILACGAFVMSSLSLHKAQQSYDLQANYIEYQKTQIGLIEQQHQQVRAQFTALLSGEVGDLNSSSMAEISAVLMTIDDASSELKKAILAQPMNSNYSAMLARTYQKELKFLNKFKTANDLSI